MNSKNSVIKAIKSLMWLTQLGISTAVPLLVCVLGSVWLRDKFGLGDWILAPGIVLGLLGAADGLRMSFRVMWLQDGKKKEDVEPPSAFNDHE